MFANRLCAVEFFGCIFIFGKGKQRSNKYNRRIMGGNGFQFRLLWHIFFYRNIRELIVKLFAQDRTPMSLYGAFNG